MKRNINSELDFYLWVNNSNVIHPDITVTADTTVRCPDVTKTVGKALEFHFLHNNNNNGWLLYSANLSITKTQ